MTDIVLGAGIVGTSVALHLQRRGREVVLVDKGMPGRGTSFGNAGLIERTDLMPRTFPRDWRDILRYASGRDMRARLAYSALPQFAPFLIRYWWASAPKRAAGLPEQLAPLFLASLEAHEELMDLAGARDLLRYDGWLHLFRETGVSADMAESVKIARDHGMRADIVDGDEIAAREPALKIKPKAGIHWRDSASVSDPGALTARLAAKFEEDGGALLQQEVGTIAPRGAGWRVKTGQGVLEGENLVIALGPWADDFIRPLGYRFPLAVKRGYHMHYAIAPEARPHLPVIDATGGIAISPMTGGMRLSTAIEFARRDAAPDTRQLAAAETHARALFALGERLDAQPWLGARPCTADMKPVIGPAHRHTGLWFAFGHAHHGLTLGPVTGRMLAQAMTGEPSDIPLDPFLPARFGR